MTISDIAATGANVASIAAIVAAGAWFIYTTKFKQRLQFDVDCRFIGLLENPRFQLVELQFIVENKGFVEHRLWSLTVSVHAIKDEKCLTAKPETKEIEFKDVLLPETDVVPKRLKYYFVRPGVRQVFTHVINIPSDISAIRVTSGFGYDEMKDECAGNKKRKKFPHTARRVFPVPRATTAQGGA